MSIYKGQEENVIKLTNEGYPTQVIADATGVRRRTVQRIRKRFGVKSK